MIDNLEDRFLAPFEWRVCGKQSPDPKMNIGALCFRNQRVRGFLDAVVKESVRTFRPEDKAGLLRVVQVAIELLLRVPVDP